ncbi:hypothetical protein ACTVNX_03725 [Serratia nevei]|uniref:hypothetical protein n=1 Tax=Serratia TaxID=613 RepID=UPI0018D82084|nr:hypothetical protein [Serratia marcescens]MBI6126324.1 hypothetical protein [Serratia marcescens]MBN5301061.1 hypothetical protein [Serratia marcescens]MDU6300349.1 hypothetical protein [Serratia marcescens]
MRLRKTCQLLPFFAKLAGKSCDQVNRDIKAGRLLSFTIGKCGQRIPDWQLDPRHQPFVQAVLARAGRLDGWQIYKALSEPVDGISGKTPLELVAVNPTVAVQAIFDALGLVP